MPNTYMTSLSTENNSASWLLCLYVAALGNWKTISQAISAGDVRDAVPGGLVIGPEWLQPPTLFTYQGQETENTPKKMRQLSKFEEYAGGFLWAS